MPRFFAGIALLPTGVEEYNVFISLVSSTKGSVIENRSTSSPVNISMLTETVRSLFSLMLPNPEMVDSYVVSVPPAFPSDRYYNIFKALRSQELMHKDQYSDQPLNHGEPYYAMRLPEDTKAVLLVLDFTVPGHLYAASLTGLENWMITIKYEHSISFSDMKSLQGTLQKLAVFEEESGDGPDEIVLIKPTGKPFDIDVDRLVADLYPKVSVSMTTLNDIAQSAASLAYTNTLFSRRYIPERRFGIIAPISVATASGATALLAPFEHGYYKDSFITFTNCMDDQKSVTVRLLLGNHRLAKNNLQRDVATLDNLNPLPKGEARIRVWLAVLPGPWGRDIVRIVIEQKDGPFKMFLFSRFFTDFPRLYLRKYETSVKKEEEVQWTDESEVVVGRLPE